MHKIIINFLHRLLEVPFIFELQQRLCNNYSGVLQEFSEILGANKRLSIIDIGCSTGACASVIINMRENSYVGIDIDQSYVEAAAKRSPNGEFLVMDARNMNFPDSHFDLAMFIGVMHHMDDELIRACLKEISRVLKPDGKVIVAEPVYTRGHLLSTIFLNMDRGKYIRNQSGYESLFNGFKVHRQRFFRFSLHRFCSFILVPYPAKKN